MGMCLESTPEMGEYAVEVRRESFYLSALAKRMFLYSDSGGGTDTVEINLDDIPKIRACLDAVEAHHKGRS